MTYAQIMQLAQLVIPILLFIASLLVMWGKHQQEIQSLREQMTSQNAVLAKKLDDILGIEREVHELQLTSEKHNGRILAVEVAQSASAKAQNGFFEWRGQIDLKLNSLEGKINSLGDRLGDVIDELKKR